MSDTPGTPTPVSFYSGTYSAQDSVGYLMRRVLQSIAQQADARLAPHELTHGQWMPLFVLLKAGGCATVATVARDINVDPGAATRMLDRLERKGFVGRCRSTEDRRVVNVTLTDAGRRVADDVPKVLSAVLNEHLAGFSHDEWQTLLALLRRMLANAEAVQSAAPAAPIQEEESE
ncbi:MarR family winged helix-turn-helix transcriptional regulator [Azohydromonas caseinilytica]|uniref:Winged helix-turn-helix transcriptional regulator n=1 Tax=Azohydromonas caseinilytica TaxID=2728836 RepID=A0A848FBJ0_9BURK|nr:MarR family winged helix-turn-helix transcriptional regulator [Azohydromonas caseinilytica]NML15560.1 winged helix-turn-helix transcriptional regulator [Azohydromonas caseinilytica]